MNSIQKISRRKFMAIGKKAVTAILRIRGRKSALIINKLIRDRIYRMN